jgi:hypothetical protein
VPQALLATAALVLAGCETTPQTDHSREVLAALDEPLVIPYPPARAGGGGTGRWTKIPRTGGAEYVQALDNLEDIISFYGFSSEVGTEVKSFDDLETLMRADGSLGFQELRRSSISGVPVLWFDKLAPDSAAGTEELAAALRVKPRTGDVKYRVRTRGVFLFHEGPVPRFVTIACARTSPHGEIGDFYQRLFLEWVTSIVQTRFL